jgi:iron complex outermembrane receptor protein
MKFIPLRAILLAGGAFASAQSALAAADTSAAPTPAEASDSSEQVGDIVVTGRYKGDDLQKVPIAITALSAEQLASVPGDFSLRQLQRFAPSLQIQGFSVRNQTITIRGLGTNSGQANEGLDQGVGIYIDGVYYARTGTALNDLLDVESLQVLRGPQGTLFGKNTVAGAIDIRTRAPSFTPEMSLSLTGGNYRYIRVQASASVPLSSTLALRLSGSANSRDGTIRNTRYNDDWDDRRSYGGKADLLWKPSDDFSIRLIGDYSTLYGTIGFATIAGVLPATKANGSTVRDFYARATSIGYTLPAIDPYARTTDINGNHDQKLNSGGASAHIEGRVGPLLLTSITAYRKWTYYPHYDGDQIGADISPNSTVAPHQRQFSQELRVSSADPGAVQYTAGLYYFWQKGTNYQSTTYGKDAAKWYLGSAAPDALLNGLEAYSVTVPVTHSYAGFGQATWTFAPRWSVTGGLRYTWEKKSGSYFAEQRGDVAPIASLPIAYQATAQATRDSYAPSGGDYSVSNAKDNISGLASLNYEITSDTNVYATYSRGYKSAAVNLVRLSAGLDVIIKPERSDAYEVGLKTRLFDRALEFNTALFWTNVANYQSNIYDVDNRITYLSNAGKVRTRGVEIDARAAPFKGLTLAAAGTFNDAKYLRYTNALCPYALSYQSYCDISGQPLSGVSKWAGSIWGEYAHPLGDKFDGYVGGDIASRSSFFSTVNDDPYAKVRGYTLVGARVGVRTRDGLDLSLWASNVLNKKYFNTLSVNSAIGTVQAVLGDPRTYGLSLRAKF